MTISQTVDTIIVLVDINDPLTYDKEFVKSIRYSPYVAGGTEISTSSRKAIKAQRHKLEPLHVDKFVIEVYTDKFGDFVSQFLANETHQRSLIYREFRVSEIEEQDIPNSAREFAESHNLDVHDLLEDEAEVVHIYELKSGPSLEEDGTSKVDEDEEDDIEDEVSDNDVAVIDASNLLPSVESDEQEEDMDDRMESMVLHDDVFIAPSTKAIH